MTMRTRTHCLLYYYIQSQQIMSPRLARWRLQLHAWAAKPPLSSILRNKVRRRLAGALACFALIVWFVWTNGFGLSTTSTAVNHTIPQTDVIDFRDDETAAPAATRRSRHRKVTDFDFDDPKFEDWRSFEEPDFSLLDSLQPHEIGCDIPVDFQGQRGLGPHASPQTTAANETGKLVFLGIFSAVAPGAIAADWGKGAQEAKKAGEMRDRRNVYREHIIPQLPKELVEVKFILGRPERMTDELVDEMEQFGDMVILDVGGLFFRLRSRSFVSAFTR